MEMRITSIVGKASKRAEIINLVTMSVLYWMNLFLSFSGFVSNEIMHSPAVEYFVLVCC